MYRLGLYCLLSYQFIVWTIVPYYSFPTGSLDSVEMIAWGRSLDFGYYKHPPLPSWIVIGFEQIFPTNLAIYISSQFMITLTALGVWAIARDFVSKYSAYVAVGLLFVLPYTTWISSSWNHDIAQMPFWVWTIVAFHWVCKSDGKNIYAWALMAVVSALGLYAKYTMGVLYISIFLYAIIWRREILKYQGIMGFCLIFLGVLTPHVIWLYQVEYLPFTYAQDRLSNLSVWFGLGSFLGAQIINLTLVILGVFLARKKCQPIPPIRHSGHFLTYMVFAPFVVITMCVVVFGVGLHSRWGYPFLSFVPLWLIWRFNIKGYTISMVRGLLWVCIINMSIAGYYAYHYKTNFTNAGFYPSQRIANQIEDIWQKHMHTKLSYIAGNQWTAGTISVYAPAKPKFIVDNTPNLNPSIDFLDVKTKGYMYVWRPDETPNTSNFYKTGTISVLGHGPYTHKYTIHWGIFKF